MLYDAVSLGIRYRTFRDNLVVSYQRVDNIKNISLHEDVFKGLFRNVDKNLPVTRRHIPSVPILNVLIASRIEVASLEARMAWKGLKHKILK